MEVFLVGGMICLVISVDERDHRKNHQVQTQQGLRDGSFFVFSVVLHGRLLSWWSDLSGYFPSRIMSSTILI